MNKTILSSSYTVSLMCVVTDQCGKILINNGHTLAKGRVEKWHVPHGTITDRDTSIQAAIQRIVAEVYGNAPVTFRLAHSYIKPGSAPELQLWFFCMPLRAGANCSDRIGVSSWKEIRMLDLGKMPQPIASHLIKQVS